MCPFLSLWTEAFNCMLSGFHIAATLGGRRLTGSCSSLGLSAKGPITEKTHAVVPVGRSVNEDYDRVDVFWVTHYGSKLEGHLPGDS
jgi:hypothetical protein